MAETTPDGADADDVLYEGEWLTVRAMRRRNGDLPAKDWYDALDARGRGQVRAAAAVLENTLQSGRPPAGRAEKIPQSEHGLSELRVTKAGSTPPHLRVLFLRQDRTLWAAVGFTKTQNRLTKAEISAGDSVAGEWLTGEPRVR